MVIPDKKHGEILTNISNDLSELADEITLESVRVEHAESTLESLIVRLNAVKDALYE